MNNSRLPLYVCGTVIKGFGRGSKELGIPTANFPEDIVDAYSDVLDTGVYYGWARVDDGPIHKMVMSVGWNPFYKNKKKSMETHIMHKFTEDFYGSKLRVAILGYERPEMDFNSLEDLIIQIKADIDMANYQLDRLQDGKECDYLTKPLDSVKSVLTRFEQA